MKIYFVTGNPNKYSTALNELSAFDIQLEHKELEFPEPRTYDLGKIAIKKALFAYDKLQKPLIVNDSGFYLLQYRDYPGPYTNHAIHGLGTKILKLLEGEDRSAEFRHCVAFIDENHSESVLFPSVIKGRVPEKPKGNSEGGWSIYHTIFIPEGFEKTLAEIRENELEYRQYYDWRIKNAPIFRDFGVWLTEEYKLK
jgi:XTP/dITP diphosphohydrolase